MLRRKLTPTDIFLILANLLPVYGVFELGWKPVEVFIVYTLETMIVGFLTVVKLGMASLSGNTQDWYVGDKPIKQPGFLSILFFILHYGIFTAIQTSIFSESANITPPGSGTLYFFFHWYRYINRDILIMLCGFIASWLVGSFVPFVIKKEYKTVPMIKLIFQPYGRIFIQQLTVLLGSVFLNMGAGKGFILVFALVKILVDVYLNFDKIVNKPTNDAEVKKASRTDKPDLHG